MALIQKMSKNDLKNLQNFLPSLRVHRIKNIYIFFFFFLNKIWPTNYTEVPMEKSLHFGILCVINV